MRQSPTYRTRLISGIILVTTPILILMTTKWLSITSSLTLEREISHINSIGRLLGDEVGENLEQQADEEITEIMSLTAKLPDIVGVHLIDSDGVIVHSADSTSIGKMAAYTDTLTPPADNRIVRFYHIQEGNQNYSIQLIYSLIGTRQDMGVAQRWAIFFDLLLFFSALLFAWYISAYMEKPVREATQAAELIASGKFDINLKQKTQDAYGKLIDALNRMAQSLKQLTYSMQKKVDAATGELAEKNRRLMELDTLKTDFVAMVSHELRTPLTSIIGFSKALQREPLPFETTVEYSGIIEQEGKQLAALVEEFLDVSKIEKGTFTLDLAEVDIGEVIRDVLVSFPWSSRVDVDIQERMPSVRGDAWRLKRLLRNLLDNAVKHGGVEVSIWVKAHSSENTISVSVSDNGPGIAEEIRKTMFNKYYTTATSNGGSGLGLAIARAIVEAHGGTIICDSIPDVGTTFTFTIPVYQDRGSSGR
ncbi:MAG: ATP-binding protein [Chitinivibrionales bacterium]